MKRFLSTCVFILAWGCSPQVPVSTLPQEIKVSDDLAFFVDTAVPTKFQDPRENYTLLSLACEWTGSDPRALYKVSKPILTGIEHKESQTGHTWYSLRPIDWGKHGGLPFLLQIKNPPPDFVSLTIQFSLKNRSDDSLFKNLEITLHKTDVKEGHFNPNLSTPPGKK